MQTLEGLADRALAIDGNNLQILRWGAEQNRVPLFESRAREHRPR